MEEQAFDIPKTTHGCIDLSKAELFAAEIVAEQEVMRMDRQEVRSNETQHN